MSQLPDLAIATDRLAAGDAAQAIAICEAILTDDAEQAAVWELLGQAHQAQARWEEAAAAYRHALALDPDRPNALWQLGEVLLAGDDREEALALKQAAIALQPELVSAEVHNQLGLAAIQRGDVAAAIAAFQRAVQVRSDYAEGFYNLGLALTDGERTAEAIVAFEQAARLQPEFAPAHFNLGTLYQQQQDLARAAASFQRAATLTPDDAAAWVGLGHVLLALDRADEAVAAFQTALTLCPQDAEALCGAGIAWGKQEAYDQAIAAFQQALALDPNLAIAHTNLGITYLKQKQHDLAIAHLQQAIALDPTAALAYNHLGSALAEKKDYEAAKECLETAVLLDPNDATAFYHLGLTCDRLLAPKAAADAYRAAIALQPDFALAYRKLDALLQRLERNSDILSLWQATVEAFARHCGDREGVYTRTATIGAYLILGLNGEGVHQEFLALERHLAECSETLTTDEIRDAYERLLLYVPCLRDDAVANRQFMQFLGNLYAERVAKGWLAWPTVAPLPCSPDRPLRIGILCAHFYRHSVGWVSVDWIAALAQLTPHLFLYDTGRAAKPHDPLKHAFQHSGAIYREPERKVESMEDVETLVAAIAADQLDVLLDLDSITYPINLGILLNARVPVRAVWSSHDAPFLDEAIHFLCDGTMYPPGVEAEYRERLVRLPDSYLATRGFDVDREVVARFRPALGIDAEAIVYLCVAPGHKFHADLLSAHAQILQQVPQAVLVHKAFTLTPQMREAYHRACDAAGVDRDRVKFLGAVYPEEKHRAAYLAADVLLDTYPFNAGVIALEALWFDLPVVTLSGAHPFSRTCLSFLKTLGIAEGRANTWEEYVAWAVRYGHDKALRDRVRSALAATKQGETLAPLWNPDKFARNLYATLEQLVLAGSRPTTQDPGSV